MEDGQIFLLILLLTCVYVAQIERLASYRETGSRQVTNPEWRCHFTDSTSTIQRAENFRPRTVCNRL